MSGTFKPRMEIMPPAQQRLWPELRPVADLGFALYGGTAIALRLGHRPSVDFDFISEKPLDRDSIHADVGASNDDGGGHIDTHPRDRGR